jgi:hypothetical protein
LYRRRQVQKICIREVYQVVTVKVISKQLSFGSSSVRIFGLESSLSKGTTPSISFCKDLVTRSSRVSGESYRTRWNTTKEDQVRKKRRKLVTCQRVVWKIGILNRSTDFVIINRQCTLILCMSFSFCVYVAVTYVAFVWVL